MAQQREMPNIPTVQVPPTVVVSPALVRLLADMVEAALRRDSATAAEGVQCATKGEGARAKDGGK